MVALAGVSELLGAGSIGFGLLTPGFGDALSSPSSQIRSLS